MPSQLIVSFLVSTHAVSNPVSRTSGSPVSPGHSRIRWWNNYLVQSIHIVPGKAHAYRVPRSTANAAPVKVQVLASPRRGQVRVRHLDGELEGLEEWIKSRDMLCLWKERKAFLRDERNEDALRRVSEEARERVEEEAISNVITATGEAGGFIRSLTLSQAQAERLWARAHLPGQPHQEPYAYVDRTGRLHLPYLSALRLAKAFAAAEPEPCLLYIRQWREELRAKGYVPGESFEHEILRDFEPGFALVESWTRQGLIEPLEAELVRVRGIADRAISALADAGQKRQATSLKRSLNGM